MASFYFLEIEQSSLPNMQPFRRNNLGINKIQISFLRSHLHVKFSASKILVHLHCGHLTSLFSHYCVLCGSKYFDYSLTYTFWTQSWSINLNVHWKNCIKNSIFYLSTVYRSNDKMNVITVYVWMVICSAIGNALLNRLQIQFQLLSPAQILHPYNLLMRKILQPYYSVNINSTLPFLFFFTFVAILSSPIRQIFSLLHTNRKMSNNLTKVQFVEYRFEFGIERAFVYKIYNVRSALSIRKGKKWVCLGLFGTVKVSVEAKKILLFLRKKQ